MMERYAEKEREREKEMGKADAGEETKKKETRSESETNIVAMRQMPRGRSERGRMIEINGEWQLWD